MEMDIVLMEDVTNDIVAAFNNLIPQLTHFGLPPTVSALTDMAESDSTYIFLACTQDHQGQIVGTATLGTFQSPTGTHGWIEDVVVDQDYRHKGIGKALTEACIQKAQEIGLRDVNLTSNPSRKAANMLYQSMGFIQRETNIYRYPLD